MVGLLDIAPAVETVTVGDLDVPVYGVSVHGIADLLGRFPELRELVLGKSVDVDPTAKLGPDVAVAQFATVGAGVEVGEGSVLYPGVYVAPGCRLGRGCVLHPNVVLYEGTILGDRVTIHAGSVVGEDGFGYATHAGVHEKIPHSGHVELGDDVEIGACCTIDRASLGTTVIGAGTKLSNLVAIGHGTKIGRGCLLVAQVGIAGSTTIGDYCSFAGQAGVVGHITIGDGVRVGAQAGVTGDIEPGLEVLGSPAIPLADARRVVLATTRLPQLRDQVKKLNRELKVLRDRL
ncbi:hypothetical protein LCGC14_3029230, partial [marine sediment metagenome]